MLSILSKGLIYIYAFFVYIPAFYLRNRIRRFRAEGGIKKILAFPLWIVLNDENDFGESWYLNKNGGKKNLWTSIKWAYFRNNSFNWNYYVLRFPMGESRIRDAWASHRGNTLAYRHYKWEIWLKDSDGNFTVMVNDGQHASQGDRMSERFTRLGTNFAIFEEFDELGELLGVYFRFSTLRIYPGIIVMFRAGISGRGEPILDLKLKRFRKKYVEHWNEPIPEIMARSRRNCQKVI